MNKLCKIKLDKMKGVNNMSIYDINVLTNKGENITLEKYKGKVLLIVNTATKCGFTPQYKGLEELYLKYKDKGLEILDFPCNQFFHQAPPIQPIANPNQPYTAAAIQPKSAVLYRWSVPLFSEKSAQNYRI